MRYFGVVEQIVHSSFIARYPLQHHHCCYDHKAIGSYNATFLLQSAAVKAQSKLLLQHKKETPSGIVPPIFVGNQKDEIYDLRKKWGLRAVIEDSYKTGSDGS